jgi:phospholipid/cholesterol/gamma-HCH transport system ATP-binding protein
MPPSVPRPLIHLDRIHVRFGYQLVLRDVTLKIERGQTVVVIGESGCGKTVLLKTIIGLVPPTQGRVFVDGKDLSKLTDQELTQQRTRFGFVFQQAALFDSMTIGQNIAFPLRQHRRLPPEQVENIVRDRLVDVGLPESVVYKKPAELSGGMRTRVGLARALVLEPEMILYDEPTTGLDPIMSDVINELILLTSRRDNVTSVVVTHDMNTARKVADRVIMLFPASRLAQDQHQVIFDGTSEELDRCADRRVQQFVRGEAGERLTELRGELANPLSG